MVNCVCLSGRDLPACWGVSDPEARPGRRNVERGENKWKYAEGRGRGPVGYRAGEVTSIPNAKEAETRQACGARRRREQEKPGEGRESNDERSSENKNMASNMLYLAIHLIQSALGQKVETKPKGNLRERSQGRPAMDGHEVAGLPSGAGSRLGRNLERASPFRAKFDQSAFLRTGRDVAHAVSDAPMAPVFHAITSRLRNVPPTDEVPRRLGPPGRATVSYKPDAKGTPQAPVTGRVSPQPRLQGCQQRQSRGAWLRQSEAPCSERQNLRVPSGSVRSMGPVSPAIKATQWPDRTSSCQLAGSLSNSPQQPNRIRPAVRLR